MFARILAMCLACLAFASSARAYCRTRTSGPQASSCPDVCESDGLPLAWTTRELSYAFNVRGFPAVDDEDLRRIFAQSASAWSDVLCDGRSVGLEMVADELYTEEEIGPRLEEPNDNTILYYSAEQWEDNELGNSAYATTKVWFDTKSGDIVGADMIFNDSMGPFGE
ncbi:MAG TPA: hypothetical protein VFX59_26845, partial [Polyangiales bacterium]|nr:hypothetical protein [Polyangiales bacterium]